MPRACSICTRPDRAAIDTALGEGVSYRTVAGRHGVTLASVARHRRAHTTGGAERPADGSAVPDGADAGDRPSSVELAPPTRPARGYSWPPFEPGNEAALRHGIWSPRKVEPVAAHYVQLRLDDPGTQWLAESRYRAALWALARAEARVELLTEWVDRMSIDAAAESGQGRTSPLALLERWEARAARHRERLGLDPLSAARLGKDVAQGRQADAAAELTRLREEHERATAARRAEVVDGE